jgi:hypothetical protein
MMQMTYHTGQFSISVDILSVFQCDLINHVPSSNITLSPKTTTSKPFETSLLRIFLLGLLRDLASRAQTPIMPSGAGLTAGNISVSVV